MVEMTNREIQKKSNQFSKTFGLFDCNCDLLKSAAAKQGYTVIEYNHIFNDSDVQTLIDELKLTDNILRTKGFTYADANYRLVFVHEDISEQEKAMVLAHEIGHIYLEHLSSLPIIGKDVREEYEANEFAHFLLNRSAKDKFWETIKTHKNVVICILLALVISIASIGVISWVNREQQYYGEYYITSSGNKYHEKECIFVKDKTNVQRLTKDQFENGDYEPCQMCLP